MQSDFISPAFAVMVAVPNFLAVTMPFSTVAISVSELLQVIVLSAASSGPTVALRVTVSPTSRDTVVLSRLIDLTRVGTTVTAQVADISSAFAVMVAVPSFLAVTMPFSTVAISVSELLQVIVLSVASSGLTVALRVTVSPTFRDAVVLSRLID